MKNILFLLSFMLMISISMNVCKASHYEKGKCKIEKSSVVKLTSANADVVNNISTMLINNFTLEKSCENLLIKYYSGPSAFCIDPDSSPQKKMNKNLYNYRAKFSFNKNYTSSIDKWKKYKPDLINLKRNYNCSHSHTFYNSNYLKC